MILSKKQGGFLMTLAPSLVGHVSLWPLGLPPTMSCWNQQRLYSNLGPHQSSSLLRENMSLRSTRWGGQSPGHCLWLGSKERTPKATAGGGGWRLQKWSLWGCMGLVFILKVVKILLGWPIFPFLIKKKIWQARGRNVRHVTNASAFSPGARFFKIIP